jgi:hypothetical protein
MIPLRGGAEIAGRLGLAAAERILLVEAPPEFETAVRDAVAPGQEMRSTEERGLRAVKDRYDLIVLWQESRVGSRAVLDVAVKRLAPGGRLWIATALRKVSGPRTPAIHRLEFADLQKAFAKSGLAPVGEARLSAWHVAYGFAAPGHST